MKIKAQDVLRIVDTVNSPGDLDAVLTLTVDDAMQLALRQSANTRLEPVWYEKILAKLGDSEKEMFTLGLASSGIKVVPTATARKKASVDSESHIDRIKKHIQKLVADKGYVSEDEYRDALWDKEANVNVPDKVVGEINAWVMQSMIPLKKNKPKGDVSPGYRKKVLDQVKNPNVNKLKGNRRVAASEIIPADSAELTDNDRNVISAFTEQRKDEGDRLRSTGKSLEIAISQDEEGRTRTVAHWDEEGLNKIFVQPGSNALDKKIVQQLIEYVPQVKIARVGQFNKRKWHAWRDVKKEAWLPIEKEDANAIKSFLDHKAAAGENVFSDGKQLHVVTEDHAAVIASWRGEKLMTNPPETQFEDVVLSWLFRWEQKDVAASQLLSAIALLEEQADIQLSKKDKHVIEAFVDQQSAESSLLNSNGKELRTDVPGGSSVIAWWQDDKIELGDLGTRSQQTVVHYLRKVTPKNFFDKEAQATDFAGEQSELERAIMSWEPKLKNIKEWLGDVARAKNFSDLKKLWDRLWTTKEDSAFEIDPRKRDFKEYVDFGEDDGESLDLAASKKCGRSDDAVVIARWESNSKKHWVELYKDEFGYGYASSAGGGNMGALPSDNEAIEIIKSRLDDFAPDAMKTPLKRVMHLRKTVTVLGAAMDSEVVVRDGKLFVLNPWETAYSTPEQYRTAWPTGLSADKYDGLVGEKVRYDGNGIYRTRLGHRFSLENGKDTLSSKEYNETRLVPKPKGKGKYEWQYGGWVRIGNYQAALGGAEGDEDVDKFQQAYDAVGGNVEKMVSWLKSNKGVDTTAKPELKNAITDWLKNHKRTAKGEALDADTLYEFVIDDAYLSKDFHDTFERLQAKGADLPLIEKHLQELLRDYISDVAPQTLLSTLIEVVEKLVDTYSGLSDDTLGSEDYLLDDDSLDNFSEVNKTGLVDTTEPYKREVIRY